MGKLPTTSGTTSHAMSDREPAGWMATAATTGTDRPPGLGPTRTRVLGMLQDLGEPTLASLVAERLGMHANTARFHLEALVEDGLAQRATETRSLPGRPRVRYVASQSSPPAAHRSYRLLAEILTTHIATQLPDPEDVAAAAGAAYGRRVVGDRSEECGQDDLAAVVGSMREMGFDSTPAMGPLGDHIEVTSCPFLEVATAHLPVVCAVHRGLMDGMLEALDSGVRVRRLDALVEPGRCVAHLGGEEAS